MGSSSNVIVPVRASTYRSELQRLCVESRGDFMSGMMSKTTAAALVVLCCGLTQEARSGQVQTYLSLGDSIGFGETVFQNNPALGPYSDPSNGDRGFVSMYANYLGSVYGTRPNVINLAVDGETSSSFSSGVGRVPPGPGFTDASLAELNTNYTGATPPTQASLLGSTIASEAAAGHVISNVSISLGSNDLFHLALTSQNPLADLPAALATFKSNYESLLTTIRVSLPNAKIDLIGSYDPFTATPSSPFAPLAAFAIPLLNQEISEVAGEFNAKYIDLFNTPLTTDAADYTLILNQGDVHPNFDKGYAVIAGQMVPEPSSMVMLTLGLVGLAGASVASRRLRTVA
jgi:GDSL-like Lipase/Acylhydrolase family/PEP-CTERM motif